jgi:hypothetical protein
MRPQVVSGLFERGRFFASKFADGRGQYDGMWWCGAMDASGKIKDVLVLLLFVGSLQQQLLMLCVLFVEFVFYLNLNRPSEMHRRQRVSEIVKPTVLF